MSDDHLTALDATFLELEEADRGAHMHIGAVMVFEAHPGTPPSLGELCAHIDARLAALPRYRCRLSAEHTGGLRWPAWVRDPGFCVEEHVHRAGLPGPGGSSELAEWAGAYWSGRLDRRRPLWDACLVEGLAGGRWALATKTHHALVDGLASVGVAEVLLDTSRRPRRKETPPAAEDRGNGGTPAPLRLLEGGARRGLQAVRHPTLLRDAVRQSLAIADLLVKDEVIAAPRVSLNTPIGGGRRYRVVRAELDALKRVKNELGGTVNDAVLAAAAGGLRQLLIARGEELPDRGLRAMVPVNMRADSEELALGNRVSSLFVHLPVAEPDSLRRYRLIGGETAERKRGGQAIGSAGVIGIGALAPPLLHSNFARTVFGTRLFNLTITNVPGPQLPLYAFGARMEEVYPLVPLAADHALGVAVVSYDGQMFFGLSGDERAMPDLDVLAAGIESELVRLTELAGANVAT